MPTKLLQVLERFRGEFSVKRYGAVGNGVTDDTAAIQAAIDAAEVHAAVSSAGAVVSFPPGKYRVSSTINVQEDSVHIIGSGGGGDLFVPYGACLVPSVGFANDTYVLSFDPGVKTRTIYNNRLENISIMKENGETLTNTVHGVHWRVAKGIMRDVTIDNMTGRALGIQGYDTNWKTTYSKFINCHFRRSGTNGVEALGSSADMFFTNCVFDGNTLGAGLLNPSPGSMWTSCHFTGNLNNVKIDNGATEVAFIACMLETPREHNVYVNATGGSVTSLRIIGCRFDSNALTSDATYDSVALLRDSGGNTISAIIADNHFSSSETNKPRYHVNLSGGVALSCIVHSNSYSALAGLPVNHHANAVRCLVGGLGRNVGNPTTTGAWNANAQLGVRVWDTGGTTIYECYDGTNWVALN